VTGVDLDAVEEIIVSGVKWTAGRFYCSRTVSISRCFETAKLKRIECSDLAREPHATCTQQQIPLRRVPSEFLCMTTHSVDGASATDLVPESSAVTYCTAGGRPLVVVSVVRGEHHSIVYAKCITGVTRVARHRQLVVA